MRAIGTIFYREAINCFRDKIRVISSALMTTVMLLVFSVAMGDFNTSELGITKIQYLLPGIIAATISMTAMSNSLSLIIDKSEGFMKEFLVAPISRTSIALGKILGTAFTALIQGTMLFFISFIFGMRYNLNMLLSLYISMISIAFTCSAIGLLVASKVNSQIGYQIVAQAIMTPMVFLSGAYIPIKLFPWWIQWFSKINPISYAVNACRIATLEGRNIPQSVLDDAGLVMYIYGYKVDTVLSIIIMLAVGVIFLFFAIIAFKKISATKKVDIRKLIN